MLPLLASLAFGAPAPVVINHQLDGSYVIRQQADTLDGWRFAARYDRRTHAYMVGRVYGRRIAFLSTLGVIGTGLYFSLAYQLSLTGPIRPMTAWLAGSLVGAGLLMIPIASSDKRVYLAPERHWTAEEAERLARGVSPGHGLQIIDAGGHWAVINRAGRALNAVEVAARLGDRATLGRARRQSTLTTLLCTTMSVTGYALFTGGMAMATAKDERTSFVLTGAGAMAGGLVLTSTGLAQLANKRRKAPARYWDRATLQQLIESEP